MNAFSARGPCNFGLLTDLALLVGVGSKDGSREELACESLHSGTLSSTRFSLNSCSHSGISEQNGSLVSFSWSSFFLVLDFWLAW